MGVLVGLRQNTDWWDRSAHGPNPRACGAAFEPGQGGNGARRPNTSASRTRAAASYNGLIFHRTERRLPSRMWPGASRCLRWARTARSRRAFDQCRAPVWRPGGGKHPRTRAVADGQRLYVALNLSNRLLELELRSGNAGALFRCGRRALRSGAGRGQGLREQLGGRRPEANQLTGPAGHGTEVRVDPVAPHRQRKGSVVHRGPENGSNTGGDF